MRSLQRRELGSIDPKSQVCSLAHESSSQRSENLDLKNSFFRPLKSETSQKPIYMNLALKTIGKCSARGISDILGEEEKYCIEREDPADQRRVDIPTTFFDSGMQ